MGEATRLTDTVRDLLESGRRERLNQILEDAHAADIAAALRELPLPDQVTLFRLLGRESAGAVLAELGDQAVHELAGALDEGEISSILDRMRPDDAAQVLEELPAEQAEKVLDLMREEKSEEVQGLLEYGEKTAGRLMTPDMLGVLEYVTVAQAVEQVRKSPVAETAPVLYVVDDHDHLVGSLPWRRLITADPTAPVGLLRQEEPVSVTPETDQEEVRPARRQVQPGGHPGGRQRPSPAGGDHGRRHHRRHPGGGHRGHPAPRWGRRRRDRPGPGPGGLPQAPGLAADQPGDRHPGRLGDRPLRELDPGAGPPGRVHADRGLHGRHRDHPDRHRGGAGARPGGHVGGPSLAGAAEGDHPGRDHRAGQWPGHGRHRLPVEGAGPPRRDHRAGP